MKFSYQLSHRELGQVLALVGTPIVGAWQVYLVVAVTMLPSIVLFAALGAEVSLGWFSVMAISVLVGAAWAYVQRAGYPVPFPESIEFQTDQLIYTFGQSRIECRWNLIDGFEDHGDYLLIFCNGRPWMLPHRVLAERREEVLEFLTQVINAKRDQAEWAPLDIYREQILAGAGLGYNYRVTQQDVQQAVREKFQLVPLTSPVNSRNSTRPQRATVQRVFVILFFLLLFQIIYFSLGASFVFPRTRLVRWVLTLLGWVLPFIWLWSWAKWSWLFRIRAIRQRVPRLESTLKLNSIGWVIANPSSGTQGNWRDLHSILQSEHFIGLKMINQLAYLIPKRIFSSASEGERFMSQAIQYFQDSQLGSSDPTSSPTPQIVIKETNNPYQAPLN